MANVKINVIMAIIIIHFYANYVLLVVLNVNLVNLINVFNAKIIM